MSVSSIMSASSAVLGDRSGEIQMIGSKTYARQTVGGSATSAINLTNQGDLSDTLGSVGGVVGAVPGALEWHRDNPNSDAAGDWEVRATVTAGTLTGGVANTWLPLTATRQWTKTSAALTAQVTLTFEFRLAGTTAVLATVTGITLSASSDPI